MAKISADLKSCVEDAAMSPSNFILGGAAVAFGTVGGHFAVPGQIAAGASAAYLTIKNGTACIDRTITNTSRAIQYEVHRHATKAAQGSAFHPASTFLHRLNQKGGAGTGPQHYEKRPYPRRTNGELIPMVSIVNRVSPNALSSASPHSKTGDLTVPALSQDIGFGYPEVSKAGSLIKISFTGYWHGDAGMMDPLGPGPYGKPDNSYDAERSAAYFENNRKVVANLILGLALRQSPLLMNQGKGAATASDVVNAFTTPDADG